MSAATAKIERAEAMLASLPAPSGDAAWAAAARAEARERLLRMGAPIKRDEYWKYTDPSALTAPLAPADAAEAAPEPTVFDVVEPAVFVFVNGVLRADLSSGDVVGVEILPLATALSADISFARELFGAEETAGQEKVARPLAAFNTAVATEGLALRVTGEADRPILIRYLQVGETSAPVRHLLRVEAGASATIIESGHIANAVIEAHIAAEGSLAHVREQIGGRPAAATHLFARVANGARLQTFTLTADGPLTRNEVVFDLEGDDAVGHAAGAILGKDAAHIDNTVFVTHTGERGESRQVYKSVLDGRGRSVFQGKIFVRQSAQKTDGYQITQSVLLSETAEFDAKPELEIYADDVACSHGSTTGAIDEEALFYLRARGVPKKTAEAMVVTAFVDEALGEIADERLADIMRARVADWMTAR